MATVKLSKDIISKANAGQIENPDLTYEFIKNILIAQQEALAEKLEAYQFNEN